MSPLRLLHAPWLAATATCLFVVGCGGGTGTMAAHALPSRTTTPRTPVPIGPAATPPRCTEAGPRAARDPTARRLQQRFEHHQPIRYEPDIEVDCGHLSTAGPIVANVHGERAWFRLSGYGRHVRVLRILHPSAVVAMHWGTGGDAVVSRRGVITVSPITQVPGVEARLRNGQRMGIAIANSIVEATA